MEGDQLLISLMQVFIAQMDSALKISNIISEHSNEETMSPDSLVTGLIYRLMVSMDESEMKESIDVANNILNNNSSNSSSDSDSDSDSDIHDFEIENKEVNTTIRNIKKNTCNCNICARARSCILNYSTYETNDQLAQKFKDSIDKTCKLHNLNIA